MINLETLMLLDECILSNDNNRDQKKQQITTEKNFFLFNAISCLCISFSETWPEQSILFGALRRVNKKKKFSLNPFTPTSDQDRISPYNINTISSS